LKFKTNAPAEPDINLIPFIDVLLVILIFLMLTTTWSKFNELNLSLPTANAEQSPPESQAWVVEINAQGMYAVNGSMNKTQATLLIKADASATHQSVVNVLEAARTQGISKIAFATQNNALQNSAAPKQP
jgi:biopolymer transport protein ExbD